jgi:hypothetical protein
MTMSDERIGSTPLREDLVGRIAEWEHALHDVQARHEVGDGLRLELGEHTPIGRVAELAAAEQEHSGFFRFALTVDRRGSALEVAAPPERRDALYALFA